MESSRTSRWTIHRLSRTIKNMALGLRIPGLHRRVDEVDLVIHDEHLDGSDARNAGYNLGDLLNMPYLQGAWRRSPHNDPAGLERMCRIASMCPSSILAIYCRDRPADEPVPCIPRLRAAVMEYSGIEPHAPSDELRSLLKDPRCVCVHVRTGDVDAGGVFKAAVLNLSKEFERVILLSGVHLDQHFKSHELKKKILVQDVNAMLQSSKNAYLYLDHPDAHLCAMMLASNLLVHRGGFSAIGAIIATGRVYATDVFEFGAHAHWRAEVHRSIVKVMP
jgi:hypothetical protein